MSIWDATIRASNLFTYKTKVRKELQVQKTQDWKRLSLLCQKKPRINTENVSKDMRLTTLGPVRCSITNEKGKKKKANYSKTVLLSDEELVQSPDMNMTYWKCLRQAPQKTLV